MFRHLLLVAAAALCLSSSAQAKPYSFDPDTIVQVVCADGTGTAVKIGDDEYVTAAHVAVNVGCKVGDTPISNIRYGEKDVAVFTGPKSSKKIKYRCSGFHAGETYIALGYAYVKPDLTYEPLIAADLELDGYQSFVGEIIPGQSGGAVIDRQGRVVGIVNMRWPARSLALRNTPLCGRK